MSEAVLDPVEEAKNRIERAYRVQYEKEPDRSVEAIIRLASVRVSEGEIFRWEGTEPLIRYGLAGEETRQEKEQSDILAMESSTIVTDDDSRSVSIQQLRVREMQYCRYRSVGDSQATAYIKAGYKTTTANSAAVCACMLERRPYIRAYLNKLKESSYLANVVTLSEKRSDLADVWRTPVGAIDENHPFAQEVTIKTFTDKDGNQTGQEKKIKMVGKLEALKLDAQLAGELKEQVTVSNSFNFAMLGDHADDQGDVIELPDKALE